MPANKLGTEYDPLLSTAAVTFAPVERFETVINVPGTADPEASVTLPTMLPVIFCAAAEPAKKTESVMALNVYPLITRRLLFKNGNYEVLRSVYATFENVKWGLGQANE